ncbi:hypothetical protein LI142_22670 [Eubacterium limosum]|uniref:hypothetical protein n=1 Tax=Eubacterium limosum TaxID=1736 RepID=UPI001D068943|nr:hypothetical protein [Eubacterium limosum]MCB6572302.1 hypothetical protein [Eubacterium limosum]
MFNKCKALFLKAREKVQEKAIAAKTAVSFGIASLMAVGLSLPAHAAGEDADIVDSFITQAQSTSIGYIQKLGLAVIAIILAGFAITAVFMIARKVKNGMRQSAS